MSSLLVVTECLLDGIEATPRPGYVRVEDGLIHAVGHGRAPKMPANAAVIDCGARTVLPGLIDAHAHVAGLLRDVPDPAADGPRTARDVIDALVGLGPIVRSGVTTLRDCGFPHHGIFAIREALDSGAFPGPRLILSGRAICATGGHGAHLSVEIDGPVSASRAVRVEAKAGAEWLKVMITGGTATPGEEVTDVQLSLEEAAAIVDEAHRRGRRVCAHVSNLQGTHLALDAGVDSLEHGIALDDSAVERMVRTGTWLVSTLLCTKIEGEAGPASGIPEYTRRKGAAIYRDQMASFRRALGAGVHIAAGTDAAVPYLPLGGPGMAAELGLMVELGMSPIAAIASATSSAAAMLGLEDRLGTLAAGMWADLIIVDDNPLQNLETLAHPWAVVSRGRIVQGPGSDASAEAS